MADSAATTSLADVRISIIHILLTTYSASIYAYLLSTVRASAHNLAPVVTRTPQTQVILDQIGTHLWWALLLAAAVATGLFSLITIETSPDMANPWAWEALNYDTLWHRVLLVCFGWWIGCSMYVVITESARLSRLSNHIEAVDLMDLGAYQPLVRQGLTNALLVIGTVSVASLFLVEPGYGSVLVVPWIASVIIAWVGLMLPLSAIRRKIKSAKRQELAWCAQALKNARDDLKSGTSGQQSMAELVAYQATIDHIRNWPFDNPTLVRFALYLLIPLGSWLGGAFVERGLDLFLS
ncbi:MAG: hypothetical protein OES38_01025 [Gammaproteobacteria bacterium]|nr:hypothetical protein [Gammaproteobacteria bacterium]